MRTISLKDLYEKSQNLEEGEVILDVRRPEEFSEGHIKGGINISHDNVASQVDRLREYKNIYIHCKMGGRAKMAYNMLEGYGITNLRVCVEAGFNAWVERGYPVEKD